MKSILIILSLLITQANAATGAKYCGRDPFAGSDLDDEIIVDQRESLDYVLTKSPYLSEYITLEKKSERFYSYVKKSRIFGEDLTIDFLISTEEGDALLIMVFPGMPRDPTPHTEIIEMYSCD